MIPHVGVAFGDLPERLKTAGDEVAVPRDILVRLMDLYISCWEFDETWYLATYPDIQDAVRQGLFPSGSAHFRTVGYLRAASATSRSSTLMVHDTYPDIAQAMLEGKVTSALDHFVKFGYQEGRLPHDPGLYPKWYAPRYVPSVDPAASTKRCLTTSSSAAIVNWLFLRRRAKFVCQRGPWRQIFAAGIRSEVRRAPLPRSQPERG